MPFSGLAPSKLNIFSKNLNVAYVHIEYSTYQFSMKSKGGGIHMFIVYMYKLWTIKALRKKEEMLETKLKERSKQFNLLISTIHQLQVLMARLRSK